MRLSDSAPFLRRWPLLGLAALFILRQGERVEARAFRQALLARIAPQTHSARPANCGWERWSKYV